MRQAPSSSVGGDAADRQHRLPLRIPEDQRHRATAGGGGGVVLATVSKVTPAVAAEQLPVDADLPPGVRDDGPRTETMGGRGRRLPRRRRRRGGAREKGQVAVRIGDCSRVAVATVGQERYFK